MLVKNVRAQPPRRKAGHEILNRRWLLYNVNLHPLGNTRAVHHHILYLLYGSCIRPVSAVSQLKPFI